ncbi:glycosyltransferase family A protein [Exiguobacterium sp. BG5(2022)]|uniref:glycosyltransferase family A protein n=1 Tax=Exiguobacterium sp. BG5(2022) TaxID=2962595 RepID=UPI0028824BD7|nr:glycosyltransferase family A protein [Exiguobacterium sp. BG5(2022)]MDT0192375.1 glycosyltransferase family A protein [Exiguobacterium sp. BG5(2022)]
MDVKATLRDVQAHIAWLKEEKERVDRREALNGDDLITLEDLPSLSRQAQRPRLDDKLFEEQQATLKTELESARARLPKQDVTRIASNGSNFYEKADVQVAFVGPVKRAKELERLCHVHLFENVTGFLELAEIEKIDFLLISAALVEDETTAFHHMGSPRSHSRHWLENLIRKAKQIDVRVVFETTLDTNHYDRFSSLAAQCDYIFTANEERVTDYIEEAGHERVFVIRPGIDPLRFNPIGMTRVQSDSVVVTNRFPVQRFAKDLETLAQGVRDANKSLYVIREADESKVSFAPKSLQDVLVHGDQEEIEALKETSNWILHVNEVKNSPTMSAQAIYEAQARGQLVLTNYNVAVNNDFPNVFIATSALDAQGILEMFDTDEERLEHQLSGVRTIFSNHTIYDRFNEMLFVLGIHHEVRRDVLVIGRGDVTATREQFERQSYPHKRFVAEADLQEVDLRTADFVTVFDDRYHYLDYYVEDMVNAFKYTDVAFVTKGQDVVHEFVEGYDDVALTMFAASHLSLETLRDDQRIEGQGYAIDHFELLAADDVLVPNEPGDYALSMIVPIYNNGRYLYNKCFSSLRRSSMFEDMEIWLVDDGSTDQETIGYIERLVRKYPNVYTYSFNDGGSGSASRPRNKGVELATTPYIAFLDPDNEAVNDGYAELFRIMKENDALDLAVGSMLKLANREAMIELDGLEKDGVRIIEDPRAYLLEHNFKVQSIQTMVIKKDFIQKHDLKQVIGAVGQDSLFFQEMFLSAGRVALLDLTIHDYYAAVAGSTVNTITKKYFTKCVIRETARAKAFAREGVLDQYRSTRFERFFSMWYLVFLRRSKPEEFVDNAGMLYEIIEQYRPMELETPIVKQFVDLYESGQTEELKRLYFDAYL